MNNLINITQMKSRRNQTKYYLCLVGFSYVSLEP